MRNQNQRVVIVSGQRIPFTKSFGHYMGVSNQEMLTHVLDAIVSKFELTQKTVGDIALGALMKSPSDWNLARESVLGSQLASTQQAYDVQRACGTSLETVNQLALKIATGQIESGIGGGSDTNSDLPIMYPKSFSQKVLGLRKAKNWRQRLSGMAKFSVKDLRPVLPSIVEPRTGMSMGEHTELMVKNWEISRAEQDQFALQSHQKAARAQVDGFFKDLVIPFHGLQQDTITRAETSLEKLANLAPAFDKSGQGSLTAGNSSSLTDGAAAVLLASESYAEQQGWPVLAYLTDVGTAAVDYVAGEDLLIAPTIAVADLLKRNNLNLQSFDIYEIHEAFAGQVLSTLKAWEDSGYCKSRLGWSDALGPIDSTKINRRGSSLAIGHPFAATGARIVAQAAKILKEENGHRALISICTAGGMGVAAILER